jgi:hypothetical protein
MEKFYVISRFNLRLYYFLLVEGSYVRAKQKVVSDREESVHT